MTNEIISYLEMCQRENTSLQKGMNFHIGKTYSVILMSVRTNAPYQDKIEGDGSILIYEGHDVPHSNQHPDPKIIDQPEHTPARTLTENGKFYRAAQNYKDGLEKAELVRVYEKIRNGIWSSNGLFELVDAWKQSDGQRLVFNFKLIAIEDQDEGELSHYEADALKLLNQHRRIIPTSVKLEVWKRDGGKCAVCGASNELHFDHIIPYSKGGTSLKSDNIQLLCARHNLEKRDHII
jgi:hypothetical protein